MIGIYKITSKKTGKSYIGQSVHCGKRLDEHCRGDQYIDKIIQEDGIENFTFEILRETNKTELSTWEDYYIIKYNTMSPNGYNMRWNCSEDLREILCDQLALDDNKKQNIIQPCPEEPCVEESHQKTHLYEQELKIAQELMKKQPEPEFIPPLTIKHWDVYYYLLEQSSYDKDYTSTVSKEDVNVF